MPAAKKTDATSALFKGIEKRHGLRLDTMDAVAPDVDVVPSGNMAIDWITGVWGLPLGRTIEMFGPPSSGKTTTALQAAVEIQRIIMRGGNGLIGPDDLIVYLDYENAMDKKYARSLGLDTKHRSFAFGQPDYLEDGADALREMAREGADGGQVMRWAVVDSVAAMQTRDEAEKGVGDARIAPQAKMLKNLGKDLNPLLRKSNGSVVFINHELDQIGGRGPVVAKTTPGGKAIKFFASVRLQYTPMDKQYGTMTDPVSGLKKRVPISTNTKVKAVKNKVGVPFREQTIRVRYGKGFDNFYTAITLLVTKKQVTSSAGYWYFDRVDHPGLAPEWMDRNGKDRPYIKGEPALLNMADLHPEWRQVVIDLAWELLKNMDDDDEGLPEIDPIEDDGVSEELDNVLGEEETGPNKASF